MLTYCPRLRLRTLQGFEQIPTPPFDLDFAFDLQYESPGELARSETCSKALESLVPLSRALHWRRCYGFPAPLSCITKSNRAELLLRLLVLSSLNQRA